jgi:hypothetical protein
MSGDEDLVPAWARPNWQAATGARTRQHYIAFYLSPGEDVQVSAKEDGLPAGDPLAGFEVQAFENANWIAGWSAGPLAAFLDAEPQVDAQAVKHSTWAMGAWSAKLDGRTLTGLQGGMALCRAFARSGAVAVLDVVALRWWSPEALLALPPARPFDITEHISITFETTPVHPEVGHLCHTRGMAKFARPDLAIHVPGPNDAADAGQLLNSIASALALGLAPKNGETTRVGGGRVLRFEAHPDDSGAPSPLYFNQWFELVPGGEDKPLLLGP